MPKSKATQNDRERDERSRSDGVVVEEMDEFDTDRYEPPTRQIRYVGTESASRSRKV